MTAFAGDIISASDVNRRIATTTRSSDTAATSGTTELQVDTVTGLLVQGRRYRIRWYCLWSASTTGDNFFFILREGSGTGGAQLAFTTEHIDVNGVTEDKELEVDYTASATASQTFTATFRRSSGGGTMTGKGASNGPASLIIEAGD